MNSKNKRDFRKFFYKSIKKNKVQSEIEWIASNITRKDFDDELLDIWKDKNADKLPREYTIVELERFFNSLPNSEESTAKPEKERKLTYWTLQRIAAIFILFFAIAGLLIIQNTNRKENFVAEVVPVESTEALLVMGNGEVIKIEDDKQQVTFSEKEQVVAIDEEVVRKIKKSNEKVPLNTISIPSCKRKKIILADGSEIWLNANSRLKFPSFFRGEKRVIELEGEALLSVAPMPEKPFIVITRGVEVLVHGTVFNICSYPGEDIVETTLLEGKVSVRTINASKKGENEMFLAPNQQAVYSLENKTFSKNNVDAVGICSWVNGRIVFREESLQKVFTKLSRWYGLEIMADPKVFDDTKFTFDIINESLENQLQLLQQISPIEYEINNRVVIIKSK